MMIHKLNCVGLNGALTFLPFPCAPCKQVKCQKLLLCNLKKAGEQKMKVCSTYYREHSGMLLNNEY